MAGNIGVIASPWMEPHRRAVFLVSVVTLHLGVVLAFGRIRRAIQAAWMMRRLGGGERATGDKGLVRGVTEAGTEYDLYEPSRRIRRTLVAVSGMTAQGERDSRLIRFCEVFAGSGFRMASVHLPGLHSFREDLADLEAIRDLVATLQESHGGQIGIVGFSFGAGIALAAAVTPELQGKVGPLILFGPHHQLASIYDALAERVPRFDDPEQVWRDDVYAVLCLAQRAREELGLDAEQRLELQRLLEGFCCEPSPEAERRFYEAALRHRPVGTVGLEVMAREHLDRLSPRGKLAELEGRVMMLTDRNDRVVPPEHSRRIFEELRARKGGHGQRLLITPLLSHVTVATIWRVHDLVRLLDVFGELFVKEKR
ncbi:MAG: alpha/beta fold hydrolase [bacterium]